MYVFSFRSIFKSVYNENAQRVDRMPKRIEIYGLSYESTLVWTGHKRLLILKWAIAFDIPTLPLG